MSCKKVSKEDVLTVNTVLHTKDGRKIGNAIITEKEGSYNTIKTDYGSECRLTDKEIKECFYIAYSNLTSEEERYMRETIGRHKYSV